jgi:hypothetical protein
MGDWNPLSFFKDLHLLPRVIFAVGGFLLLSSPFLRDFALTLFSVGLIFMAVALNFLIKLTWRESVTNRLRLSGESLWQGLLSFAIGAGCLYLATYRFHFGVFPALLRPK